MYWRQQAVSLIERCPLFRVSFTGRFYCIYTCTNGYVVTQKTATYIHSCGCCMHWVYVALMCRQLCIEHACCLIPYYSILHMCLRIMYPDHTYPTPSVNLPSSPPPLPNSLPLPPPLTLPPLPLSSPHPLPPPLLPLLSAPSLSSTMTGGAMASL